MASIHSIAHQTQTTELRACKAEVAIIMQQLSGLEWQQAIADCLPDAICWHVRKAMRQEVRGLLQLEMLPVAGRWLDTKSELRIFSGMCDTYFWIAS